MLPRQIGCFVCAWTSRVLVVPRVFSVASSGRFTRTDHECRTKIATDQQAHHYEIDQIEEDEIVAVRN